MQIEKKKQTLGDNLYDSVEYFQIHRLESKLPKRLLHTNEKNIDEFNYCEQQSNEQK